MKITRILLLILFLFVISGCTDKTGDTSEITITFKSNGGEVISPIITEKDLVITLPTPTRVGYNFLYWKNDKDITQNETAKFNSDDTLIAYWEKLEFTVRFVDFDGTLIKEQLVKYNEDATQPETPQRVDHLFTNWDTPFKAIKSNIEVKALYDQSTDGLTFDLYIDYYIVTGYVGTSKDVIIPSQYKGLDVKVIGKEAFKDSVIESVIIPNTVLYIEESAFVDNIHLEEIVIPNSVIEIKHSAFANNTSLARAVVGASIIGDLAFYSCNRLANITIQDTVTKIGISAFYNCSDLKTLTIPSSVIEINDHFVSWCQKLTTIYTDSNNIDHLQIILDGVSLIYVKALNKTVMPLE